MVRLRLHLLALTGVICGIACAGSASRFEFENTAGQFIDILRDGQPVVRYVYAYDMTDAETRERTNKPFHHVFAPDGAGFLTNGPDGLYPHHRGLFIGWRNTHVGTREINFWSMDNGTQRHQQILRQETTPGPGDFELRHSLAR